MNQEQIQADLEQKILKVKQELEMKKLKEKEKQSNEISTKISSNDEIKVKNQGPQCQKCLQIGHWSYQCKSQPVYAPRPSRTSILKGEKKIENNFENIKGKTINYQEERKRLEQELENLKRRKINDSSDSSDSSESSDISDSE